MSEPIRFDAPFTIGGQLDARATHPETENKVFLLQGDRTWTYRQLRDESVRTAHFLLRRLGAVDDQRPGHVAMLLENHFELVALLGGCGYGALTLFGVNTGLRGETLAGVVNHSRSRVLVVDERFLPEVDRIRGQLKSIARENILVLSRDGRDCEGYRSLTAAVASEVAASGQPLDAPARDVDPMANLMVIYTSGTTGLPKGINNNHAKLCATGFGVSHGRRYHRSHTCRRIDTRVHRRCFRSRRGSEKDVVSHRSRPLDHRGRVVRNQGSKSQAGTGGGVGGRTYVSLEYLGDPGKLSTLDEEGFGYHRIQGRVAARRGEDRRLRGSLYLVKPHPKLIEFLAPYDDRIARIAIRLRAMVVEEAPGCSGVGI